MTSRYHCALSDSAKSTWDVITRQSESKKVADVFPTACSPRNTSLYCNGKSTWFLFAAPLNSCSVNVCKKHSSKGQIKHCINTTLWLCLVETGDTCHTWICHGDSNLPYWLAKRKSALAISYFRPFKPCFSLALNAKCDSWASRSIMWSIVPVPINTCMNMCTLNIAPIGWLNVFKSKSA